MRNLRASHRPPLSQALTARCDMSAIRCCSLLFAALATFGCASKVAEGERHLKIREIVMCSSESHCEYMPKEIRDTLDRNVLSADAGKARTYEPVMSNPHIQDATAEFQLTTDRRVIGYEVTQPAISPGLTAYLRKMVNLFAVQSLGLGVTKDGPVEVEFQALFVANWVGPMP